MSLTAQFSTPAVHRVVYADNFCPFALDIRYAMGIKGRDLTERSLVEMKRLGYGPGLACGAVAAGGTLGFLIPPSTGFVIYAILTEESIGRLFMAGVLPGLLMTALDCCMFEQHVDATPPSHSVALAASSFAC